MVTLPIVDQLFEKIETRTFRIGATGLDSQERGRLRILLPHEKGKESKLIVTPLFHNVKLVLRLKVDTEMMLTVDVDKVPFEKQPSNSAHD